VSVNIELIEDRWYVTKGDRILKGPFSDDRAARRWAVRHGHFPNN